MNNKFPQKTFPTIYKSLVRTHLDYGDIVFDQHNNEKLCQTIESVQYKVALAITGTIKGTSQAKLCKELCIKFRWWSRRLCMFYKVKTSGLLTSWGKSFL